MIYYKSRTGNVKSIINKLSNIKCEELDNNLLVNEPFFIFTYTDNLGEVPKVVDEFMKLNYQYCKGVIASGNTNFGNEYFCASADILSKKYHIPIICKIELRGFNSDIQKIQQEHKSLIEVVN